MCDFNIFKLHQNEDLCKKLEVSILKNMGQDSQKSIFQGVVPPDLPPSGPSGGLTLSTFDMIRYYLSEVHCKKLEVSILKKHGQDSQKNCFKGGP